MARQAVDQARAGRVAAGLDRERAAATIARLRAQADGLQALYSAGMPVPPHVRHRIAEKRRTADAIESVYGESGEEVE
jgi:hypothetical protein